MFAAGASAGVFLGAALFAILIPIVEDFYDEQGEYSGGREEHEVNDEAAH